jgi:hypothetical protein
VVARAEALSLELATVDRARLRGAGVQGLARIEDIYELTYICKDGSRFPRSSRSRRCATTTGAIIGYLLIGTDNSVRKRVESRAERGDGRGRTRPTAPSPTSSRA